MLSGFIDDRMIRRIPFRLNSRHTTEAILSESLSTDDGHLLQQLITCFRERQCLSETLNRVPRAGGGALKQQVARLEWARSRSE